MTDLWKELREKNIGGSDIACLFGEGYKSHFQLWHEKHGKIETKTFDNERMDAGKFMESASIAWANHKWKLDLYQPNIYVQHATVEGMGCTPDAYSKSMPDLMAQVKNVDKWQFKMNWEYDGDTITKAPLAFILQQQHEMECTRRARSYLIANVGGNQLFKMMVDYDPELGEILRKEVQNFWTRTEPPEPDFGKDGRAIRDVKKTLPILEQDDLSEDEDIFELFSRIQKLQYETKIRIDELEEAKNRAFHLSGGAAVIRCRNFRMKFKKQGESYRMDLLDERCPL